MGTLNKATVTKNACSHAGRRCKADKRPWASAIVMVEKKDGSKGFCVEYRHLNDITIKDAYPLPRIDDSLDQLSGAEWFSCLDLNSGYWQVEVVECDQSLYDQGNAFRALQFLSDIRKINGNCARWLKLANMPDLLR